MTRTPEESRLRLVSILDARPELTPIITALVLELLRAEDLHQGWFEDPLHALAVVNEEVGELNHAGYDFFFGSFFEGSEEIRAKMKDEAVQSGAMCIRFLLGLEDYRTKKEL